MALPADPRPSAAGRARLPRWLRRGLVLGLALGLSLVAVEIALRALGLPGERPVRFLGPLAFDQDLVADESTFWRLSEHPERFHANRLRLRGWLPAGRKEPGDVRIAVVGDSCTFGSGVGVSESYGVRLERLLAERLPEQRVETIQAAMSTYTSHQLRTLYTEEIVPLLPDVTALYVGAFNDYQPALGFDDAERSALRARPWRRALGRSRLGQLLVRVVDPELAPENRVERPDHPRVPLDAFRANVAALVEAARAAGSLPILIVPPLPAETIAYQPVSREYHAALRALALERGVLLLDAPALFAPWAVALPEPWPASARFWPLFVDTVHPSALGHELIARALLDQLEPWVERWAERGPTPGAPPRLGAVTPARVCAFRDPEVRLAGAGFAVADAFDRVLVGDTWIDGAHVLDDRTLLLPLPRWLPPGRQRVTLVTRTGLVRGEDAWLEVEPPELGLTGERDGESLALRGALAGPPGWLVKLWAAPRLRAQPAATAVGPFWLDAEPDGRPAGLAHGSFVFDRLTLASASGAFDEHGRFPAPAAPYALRGEDEVFVQALFFQDASRAVLSAPLRLDARGSAQ